MQRDRVASTRLWACSPRDRARQRSQPEHGLPANSRRNLTPGAWADVLALADAKGDDQIPVVMVMRRGSSWRANNALRALFGAVVPLVVGVGPWCAVAPLRAQTGSERAPIEVLQYDGVIGPATADFFRRGLEQARERNAQLVVLELDTPGGLDTSTRDIVKEILGASVPVATWVGPSGARAASAGTYILYASHIAAMAPASNLGAATPISIGAAPPTEEPEGKSASSGQGGTLHHKVVNDAAAYLRSLAQLRGRSADFAERAVREARSLSAEEALQAHVIDLIATDVEDLARKLDGRTIALPTGKVQLHTAGAPLVRIEPGWRTRLLALVSDPTVAVVLLMLGVYGLFIEVMHPGAAVPGVAGGICLLLGLYALQLLPVNWAGVGLILLGCALMIAELFLPTFGVIGVGGIVALATGLLMLIEPEIPGFGIPLQVVIALALTSAAVIFGAGSFALRARRRPVVSGREALVGAEGTVTEVTKGEAWAHVAGESWQVHSNSPLKRGERIRVLAVKGLTLDVAVLGAE